MRTLEFVRVRIDAERLERIEIRAPLHDLVGLLLRRVDLLLGLVHALFCPSSGEGDEVNGFNTEERRNEDDTKLETSAGTALCAVG